MRRRLNFTRRIRINHSDVDIELIRNDPHPMRFEAKRTLDKYNLPTDALVYLEAYRRNSYMRFPWGTVAGPQSPGSGSRITEISSEGVVYFRVKIVGEDGIILAQADRMRANESDQSILPVESTDLDEIVWRLSFDDDEPYLLVNFRIEGILDRARSDSEFAALVYPTVLRDVLERLCDEFTEDDSEQQAWVANWEKFAKIFNSEPIPDTESTQREQWVNSIVNAFSSRHRLLSRYRDSINVRG